MMLLTPQSTLNADWSSEAHARFWAPKSLMQRARGGWVRGGEINISASRKRVRKEFKVREYKFVSAWRACVCEREGRREGERTAVSYLYKGPLWKKIFLKLCFSLTLEPNKARSLPKDIRSFSIRWVSNKKSETRTVLKVLNWFREPLGDVGSSHDC